MLELNRVYNIDCMAGMAEFPDGYFDITVVDPPYGGAGFAFSGKAAHGLAGDLTDTPRPTPARRMPYPQHKLLRGGI